MAMPNLMNTISASVGRAARNQPNDVKTVQQLLNDNLGVPYRQLTVNGLCDADTLVLIEAFQRRVLGLSNPDGRVDPNGRTLRALRGQKPSLSPTAKPFLTRVEDFRSHVRQEFGIAIAVSSDTRGADWQQRMHVAHMIKYNSFASRKPKFSKTVGGRHLLDFGHMKDAKVAWAGGLKPEDFLRGKDGKSCVKKVDLSGYDPEPDEEKTRARAYEILAEGGVATAKDRATELHSAMVAPGLQGCGEPCGCGGNRSHHLAGLAVDLNRDALNHLKLKLTPATDAQLDKLLGEFLLKRPMGSEPWHVESLI